MRVVIHDWNDEDALKILFMLALAPGGRERTEAEFAALFAEGGFQFDSSDTCHRAHRNY
jgi:hypothetical protein